MPTPLLIRAPKAVYVLTRQYQPDILTDRRPMLAQ